ncbi:MAG: class I SAM-dependent methyltransferase [Actinomycetota bacterium]
MNLPSRIRRLRRRTVGDSFRRAVLHRYGVVTDKVDDPIVQMWLDFSLSSVERGRYAVSAMGGPRVFRNRGVMDVGCAYGGFLVAAAEAGAASVVGIDIDPGLLDLARLQLADHGVRGRLAEEDITASGVVDRWGTFDVVLCNDVIEHVADPVRCAQNLAALMKPGGRVYLEIPNGSAVEFMRRDGHYGLFGLTLLGREPAEQLWRLHYHDRYGVEHYAPIDYYLQIFSAAGIALRLLPAAVDPEQKMAEISESFDELETELESFQTAGALRLAEAVRRRGGEEIGRFRQLRHRWEESAVPAERSILLGQIISTYGTTFWSLEGTKVH